MELIGLCLTCLILILLLSGGLCHETNKVEENINLSRCNLAKPNIAKVNARLNIPNIQLPKLLNLTPKNPFKIELSKFDGQSIQPTATATSDENENESNQIQSINPKEISQFNVVNASSKTPNNPFYLFILNSRKNDKKLKDLKNENTLLCPINPETKNNLSIADERETLESTIDLNDALKLNVNKNKLEVSCKNIVPNTPQDNLQNTSLYYGDCVASQIKSNISITHNGLSVTNLHNNTSIVPNELNKKCNPLKTYNEDKSLKNEINKEINDTGNIINLSSQKNMEVTNKEGLSLMTVHKVPNAVDETFSCTDILTNTTIDSDIRNKIDDSSKIAVNKDCDILSQLNQLSKDEVNEESDKVLRASKDDNNSQEKTTNNYDNPRDNEKMNPSLEYPFKNKVTTSYHDEQFRSLSDNNVVNKKNDLNFISNADKKNIPVNGAIKVIPRKFRCRNNKASNIKTQFNYGNITKPERMKCFCNQPFPLIRCNGFYRNHNKRIMHQYNFCYNPYMYEKRCMFLCV